VSAVPKFANGLVSRTADTAVAHFSHCRHGSGTPCGVFQRAVRPEATPTPITLPRRQRRKPFTGRTGLARVIRGQAPFSAITPLWVGHRFPPKMVP